MPTFEMLAPGFRPHESLATNPITVGSFPPDVLREAGFPVDYRQVGHGSWKVGQKEFEIDSQVPPFITAASEGSWPRRVRRWRATGVVEVGDVNFHNPVMEDGYPDEPAWPRPFKKPHLVPGVEVRLMAAEDDPHSVEAVPLGQLALVNQENPDERRPLTLRVTGSNLQQPRHLQVVEQHSQALAVVEEHGLAVAHDPQGTHPDSMLLVAQIPGLSLADQLDIMGDAAADMTGSGDPHAQMANALKMEEYVYHRALDFMDRGESARAIINIANER